MAVPHREIVDACLALGFAGAGVCAAAPTSHESEFRAWLADGRHGQMSWLAELLDRRLDIRRLIDDARPARSVVMVADQYTAADAQPTSRTATGSETRHASGRIARYARGRDYHAVIRRRLHALADALRRHFPADEFRSFVDTGPVLEREHAARAGLGFIGKHTLLIDPRPGGAGSYLLLGGIATTLDIEPTPRPHGSTDDHCGTCTRCIDACPTHAITPWSVDARRCISYLTIEHEGPIDPALARDMGDWVFGCDICQEVCPFNAAAGASHASRPRVHPLYRERPGMEGGRIALSEILSWTEEDRRTRLTVSAGKRATLAMLKRNAAIAESNTSPERSDGGSPSS